MWKGEKSKFDLSNLEKEFISLYKIHKKPADHQRECTHQHDQNFLPSSSVLLVD